MKIPTKISSRYDHCLEGRSGTRIHQKGSVWRQVKLQGLPPAATPAEAPSPSPLPLRHQPVCGASQARTAWLSPKVTLPTCLQSSPAGSPTLLGRRAANLRPQVLSSELPHQQIQPKKTKVLCLFSKLEPGAIPVRHAWLNGAVSGPCL